MIRPLKQVKGCKEEYFTAATFDIEGREICHADKDGIHRFRGWSNWLEHVLSIAQARAGYRRIYTHHSGGGDWCSLLYYLMDKGKDSGIDFSAIPRNGRILSCTLAIGEMEILLCDAELLVPGSCDDVISSIWGRPPANQRERAERLYEMVEQIHVAVNTIAPIGPLGLTISSTALRVWRRMMSVNNEPGIQTVWDEPLCRRLRMAYKGGRVILEKPGFHRNVYIYDVRSMYPSVMLKQEVPISDRVIRDDDFGPSDIFVTKARWATTHLPIPPMIIHGSGEHIGKGEWTMSPEVHAANSEKECCTGGETRIFIDRGRPFTRYIETIFPRRDSGSPIEKAIAKGLLNGLYGKLAEGREKESIVRTTEKRMHAALKAVSGGKSSDVSFWPGNERLMIVRHTSQAEHEHVGIAATITSAARVKFWEFACIAKRAGGLVYGDTDSIHSTVPLPPEILGNGIGCLSFVGRYSAVYLAPKCYAIRDTTTKEERVIIRGLPIAKLQGRPLTYSEFRLYWQGNAESIERDYNSAPTADDVFSGIHPASRLVRRRTIFIERDSNGEEKGIGHRSGSTRARSNSTRARSGDRG